MSLTDVRWYDIIDAKALKAHVRVMVAHGGSMDLSTTLAEIVSLSVDERIRLVEAIWDSITAELGQPELTDLGQYHR